MVSPGFGWKTGDSVGGFISAVCSMEQNSDADSTELTPALPVIEYANLRGVQPANSLFTCEYREDGVVLIEPPLGRRFLGNIILAFLMCFVSTTVLIVLIVEDRLSTSGTILIPAIDLLGVLLFFDARRRAQLPVVLQLTRGRLTVQEPTHFFTRKVWRLGSVDRFTVSRGTPTVNLKLHSFLQLKGWFFACTLLPIRPKEECEWLAKVLNESKASQRGISAIND